ncbi:MAG: tRNA pseudouridine32 synthase/23S rRNA pseudouridine746 synthase [Myxococcota bacterium]|jgi:tRNA pseudouridine32 synthase/23S rRNA pseudouridine746 synthase
MWTYAPPTEPWLSVLHHDRDLFVLDKPSGLLSVPGRDPAHHDSAYARVLAAHSLAQSVHRLDMDTSGVLVFALRRKAERALHAQFREGKVDKTYIARVAGHVAEDRGGIDLALTREVGVPRSRVDPAGKPARTRFRVLSRDPDGTTRLALTPLTGRSHQLRVHLLAYGHPILGDRFYAPDAVRDAAPRLCLHAWRLSLDQPYSGQRLRFEAPAPF